MSKETIGHIDCPICGHEMPIKADKNGHAYGHCAFNCNGQIFTRNDHRDAQLRKRMRPVTVTVPEPKADPVTEPEPEPTAAPSPAPTTAPPTAPKAPPAPTATPKQQKASWFQPVLGRAQ